ncbi:MAG: acyltransferase family protein [Myxococcales bacterium]|nr:acyltransferase family protein [Myxococcales bacterium]
MPNSKHNKPSDSSDTRASESQGPWAGSDDSYFLGAEAALPPGQYGQTIPSHLPDPVAQARVLRELQRRVRSTMSPAFPVETKRILPGAALLAGYRHFALRSRSLAVDEFGRDPSYGEVARPVLDFLYQDWLSVKLQGLENLPTDGGAILVCNHTGTLPYDATMLMHGIRTEHPLKLRVRPLLEDRLARQAFLGVALRKLGAVRACQENATRLLENGSLIAVFPEGRRALLKKRTSPEKLQRFGRGGFIRLALRTIAPLIPVAIVPKPVKWLPEGVANRVHAAARLALFPTPGPWTIQIGKPIDLSEQLAETEWEERVQVAQEAQRIRLHIAEMIQQILNSTT